MIGFVANTGGLLGLCMGFSLVSAFEILYHILISFCKYFERTIGSRHKGDNEAAAVEENQGYHRLVSKPSKETMV